MLKHETIERYEIGWLVVAVVLVILLFVGVLASMIGETVPQLSGAGARINPAHLEGTPFAQPGVRTNADGTLDVYLLARSFQFQPNVVRVPAGRQVTFHMTSADVVHGLMLGQGNVNVNIIPGQVASVRQTFKYPGSFLSECHEYCGTGHQTMSFKLIVENPK